MLLGTTVDYMFVIRSGQAQLLATRNRGLPGPDFGFRRTAGLCARGFRLVGRGEAGTFYRTQHRPRADPTAKISVCHGVGGMFAALRRLHHVE